MHSFAHSLSHPLSRREATSSARPDSFNNVVALLVAAIAALLISGALVYNSMNREIESLQATQVADQQQSVQASAMNACVDNHASGAGLMTKCRMAAATFATNDPDSGAFDKAIAYIYPK